MADAECSPAHTHPPLLKNLPCLTTGGGCGHQGVGGWRGQAGGTSPAPTGMRQGEHGLWRLSFTFTLVLYRSRVGSSLACTRPL